MMACKVERHYLKPNCFSIRVIYIAGGPLVLFNEEGDTLVISPMSNFMSASMEHNIFIGGSLSFGVMGGVNTIPENYSVDFIVYYGSEGINKAMEGWGSTLRNFYKKDNSLLQNDFTANYLGYWTDNGEFTVACQLKVT
jgi:hypothetical protein